MNYSNHVGHTHTIYVNSMRNIMKKNLYFHHDHTPPPSWFVCKGSGLGQYCCWTVSRAFNPFCTKGVHNPLLSIDFLRYCSRLDLRSFISFEKVPQICVVLLMFPILFHHLCFKFQLCAVTIHWRLSLARTSDLLSNMFDFKIFLPKCDSPTGGVSTSDQPK